MRNIVTFLLIMIAGISFGQDITIEVNKGVNGVAYLVKYGSNGKPYYADTSNLVNGKIVFDGAKQESGMLAFYYGGKLMDIVYDKEVVYIKTDTSDLYANMEVVKSENNKYLLEFFKAQRTAGPKLKAIQDKIDATTDEEEKKVLFKEKSELYKNEIVSVQEGIIKKSPDLLISKYFLMSQDVKIPEIPSNVAPEDTNIWKARYIWNNYWANVDLSDERMSRHPLWAKKLDDFADRNIPQNNPDTLYYYLSKFLKALPANTELLKGALEHYRIKYGPDVEKRMCFDKIWTYLILDFYSEEKFPWGDPEKLAEMHKRADAFSRVLCGNQAKNLQLLDTAQQSWTDMYSLPNDYVILIFWDPDCGHCKKELPVWSEKYKDSLKDMGVEVYAVVRAVEKFDEWKKFISENDLVWINVAVTPNLWDLAQDQETRMSYDEWVAFMKNSGMEWNNSAQGEQAASMQGQRGPVLKLNYLLASGTTSLESLNFGQTYDIFATPKVIILNKERKIIGKMVGPEQIVGFMEMVIETDKAKEE